jgi:hypothetical protein
MDRFESLVKPMDHFSEKSILMHKIKYTDTEISLCITICITDFITKETNHAQILVSKY